MIEPTPYPTISACTCPEEPYAASLMPMRPTAG